MGGFGSAVLEAVCDAGLDAGRIRRLGIPDQFIEHGDRSELLADLGLHAQGIARACEEMAAGAPQRLGAADTGATERRAKNGRKVGGARPRAKCIRG